MRLDTGASGRHLAMDRALLRVHRLLAPRARAYNRSPTLMPAGDMHAPQ